MGSTSAWGFLLCKLSPPWKTKDNFLRPTLCLSLEAASSRSARGRNLAESTSVLTVRDVQHQPALPRAVVNHVTQSHGFPRSSLTVSNRDCQGKSLRNHFSFYSAVILLQRHKESLKVIKERVSFHRAFVLQQAQPQEQLLST